MQNVASNELSVARPCCAVIRHAERADASWDLGVQALAGDWVCDPCLSVDGLEDASVAAGELLASVKSDVHFHVVVSSPYRRCIQTAVKVCQAIGPSTELMIDDSFGEIYGPDIFGEDEPQNPLRPREDILQYCIENKVKIRSKAMGKSPVWPEDINRARLRFVQRFLRYLHRAALTRRNFIVVTHADGVAASLGMMPSMEGRILKSVDYCGFFVAQAGQGVALKKIKPGLQTETIRAELTTLGNLDSSSCDSEHADRSWFFGASFAWQVSYGRIKIGHRANEDLQKRICRWSKGSDFSEEDISRLLRFLLDDQLTESSDIRGSYGAETMTFSGVRSSTRSTGYDSSKSRHSESHAIGDRNLQILEICDIHPAAKNENSRIPLKIRLLNVISSCCPYFCGSVA